MSLPRKRIEPEVGARNPVSRLKSVVLPAPLGPTKAWIVPSVMVRSTPLTARKPWKSLVRPRVWSSGIVERGTPATLISRSRQLHVTLAHFRPERCRWNPHSAQTCRLVRELDSHSVVGLQPCPVGLLRADPLTRRAVRTEVTPRADRRHVRFEQWRPSPLFCIG